MRRLVLSMLCAGAVLASAGAGQAHAARVWADINLHFGHRAPRVFYTYEPRVELVPYTEDVYYVGGPDYDMFRYGDWWYVCNEEGAWFRAPSYRGPFVSVSFRGVPYEIVNVPPRR